MTMSEICAALDQSEGYVLRLRVLGLVSASAAKPLAHHPLSCHYGPSSALLPPDSAAQTLRRSLRCRTEVRGSG